MNNQTLSDLLGNTVVIFLLQVAIFSLPPFYIATLRRPLRSAAFYVYVSIVLVIGGFLGAVYSIPLTESIVISGGNLAYGALMYATILLVITEADIFATRNVIRLVITVNVLKYILFSVFSWSLSLNTILNPFDTAPDLFAVSAKLMIIGGVLIIVELLILLFFFEQIKTRVSNFYAQFILFVVSFMAVLLLDGVLFPLIAFGINASLESIVVGGIVGKFVMAAAYSVALLGFLFIFRNRLTTYLAIPIGLRDQLTANREKLIEEIGRQQKSIAKKDQALHESEERLRLALKASGQGLYDLNLQTGAAEANDQYALMLGYDPETFEETNAKWIERLHPDDYEQVTQYFNDYVAGKIPEYRVDFRQKTQDGRWIWIASLGEIVEFDSAGNPLRMVGTHLNITERKTAEAQQQRSEARYRALFEYSPVSLWEEDFSEVKQAIDQLVISDGVTDLETYLQQHEDVLQALVTKVNVLDINQRTLALYRYESKESFLGNLEISSPTLLHNFISQMAAVAEGITNLQFNTQTYTVDGERLDIVLEWTVQPGYEADYGRVLISIIDITAVVQAEQALAENRRRLQALFDHSQDAIFLADDQGRYKDVNPAACNLTGYSREELLQRTVWDISPGRQEAESQALWQQFIAAGEMGGEFLIKNINGHLIETEFRAVSNITSGLHLSIMRDITERKQTERQLQYQAFLLANVSEAIISTDVDFNIKTWNRAAEQLYGWSAENVIDKHLNAVVPTDYPHDDADTVVQQFFQEGVWQGEVIQTDREGRKHAISSSVTLLKDEAGAPIGAVAVNRDISESKADEKKQKELLQQVKLAIDSAQLGLWELNLTTNHLQWNDQQLTLYNISREEFESDLDGWRSRVHPEDQAYADDRLGEVSTGKSVFDVPFRIIWPSGEIRYINASATPVFNNVGEIVKLIGINMDVTAAKVRENALKESEDRLLQRNQFIETILDRLPIGLAVNNIDQGTAVYMNAKFEEIYGWPREKLSDTEQFFQCVYPDPEYRRQIQAQIIDDIASGDLERMSWADIHISTEQGEKHVVSAKNIPIYEQNLMISTVQDITARVRSEQQLQEYTQRLEALHRIDRAILAQDSPEHIAKVTVDHLAQLISCKQISASRFDEVGQTATVLAAHVAGTTRLMQGMLVPIHDLDSFLANLRQGKTKIFDDLQQFAGSAPTIDALLEEGLRSYMTVPLMAGGRLIGSLSLGSDQINDFDENHEQLVKEVADQLAISLLSADLYNAEKSQRALAETLQATAVALVGILTLEETLDTILTQLALVVPYDLAQTLLIRDELLAVGARQGRLATDLVEEEERPYTQIPILNQSLQSGKPVVLTASQIQENHLNLPGCVVPALSSWVGIPLVARGVAVGFLTVGQIDAQYFPQQINAITTFAQQAALAIEKATILLELENSVQTLQETQAQLVRAARLSAIGETAAGVAHQINNPLTTVIIDSHLLLKNLPASHAARQSAEAIHQAALRAASVVERLLDFSRTQPTAKSPVDISDSLNESITILKAQIPENVRIKLDINPDLPLVIASPEHLQDVWLNLLLNARDAVSQLEKGNIRVTMTHSMRYNRVEVSIQDNGMGIPYDEQQKIFKPFYTTKPRGTGLGLAVCQDIILHHDGEIRVSSVEGEGSVFTVMLPL